MCQGQLLNRQIEIAGRDGAGAGKFARALLFVFRVGEGHVGASLLGLQTNRGCLGHGRARGGGAHVGLVFRRDRTPPAGADGKPMRRVAFLRVPLSLPGLRSVKWLRMDGKTMTHEVETDEDLVDLATGGDRRALEVLLRRQQAWIFNLSFYMLHHRQDAEDATAEVPVRVATGLSFAREALTSRWNCTEVYRHGTDDWESSSRTGRSHARAEATHRGMSARPPALMTSA